MLAWAERSVEWLARWKCSEVNSFAILCLRRIVSVAPLFGKYFRTEEHFVGYFGELIRLKLRSRLRSPQAIEDVRQETFVRVFAILRKDGLRQPEKLGAFVNSICNNVLMEQYRASSRNAPMEEGQETEIPDTSIDVIQALEQRQMEEKVHEILEELPEKDRRILKEVFIDERDKDEVCRDFGVDRNYLRVLSSSSQAGV